MAKSIQIITLEDHTFEVQLQNVQQILENDEIKDRHVVVVSIAGAFRKGKSFLLNFFLKYLYAQYKRHDVSDWIGENQSSNDLSGFKFRGGSERETTGIWMWSEVFTHDFPNGHKVAIILLDTQGIFDDESTTKDCTTTFAISMLLSSVQCYNVTSNIQEDDLQHLQLFTEYGRLAMEQSTEKPFQKLLFIVRDWPNPNEYHFGDGQQFIDKKLTGNGTQSSEMQQLREDLKSRFVRICAFLLPHPGFVVSEGQFIGDLKQIDTRFIDYVKELVPSLLAPENLIVKKISGREIRVRDVVTYLKTYVDIFNGDTLPEPKTVLMATAEANMQILCSECLEYYVDSMRKQIEQKALNEFEPYFIESDLQKTHEHEKEACLSQFLEKRKLGGVELISGFQRKLDDDVQHNYAVFCQENDKTKENFKAMALANIRILHADCLKLYGDLMQKALNENQQFFTLPDLENFHNDAKGKSLLKFQRGRKFGGSKLIAKFKNLLENDIHEKYKSCAQENEEKRQAFEEKERLKKVAEQEAAAKEIALAKAKAEEDARIRAEAESIALARAQAEETARLQAEARTTQVEGENEQLKKEIKELEKMDPLVKVAAVASAVAAVVVAGPGGIAALMLGKKILDSE